MKNVSQCYPNFKHLRTDSRCMWVKSVLHLSWRSSLLSRSQSIDFQNKSMDWFLYDKNLRHERVNALLLACIQWDIFLDYDKIIDIYAFKYRVVKHVRLHWNSWRWSYCFMYEFFKNTELPEKKCQHSTEILEDEVFSNTICPEGKNPTLF